MPLFVACISLVDPELQEDAILVDGSFEVRRLGSDGHFGLFGELDTAALDDLFEGRTGSSRC